MPRFHFKKRRLREKYVADPHVVNGGGHLTDSASSQKLLEQATGPENIGNFEVGMSLILSDTISKMVEWASELD